MQHTIFQLQEKTLVELKAMARLLGIKRPDSYKKEELAYKILDEEAIQNAAGKGDAQQMEAEPSITADLGEVESLDEIQENMQQELLTARTPRLME